MRSAMFALVAFLVLTISGSAKTIHVPDDYTTIQAAINAAVDGDTVLVRPGTYVENIVFNGKTIIVASTGGAYSTIIDGNDSGSCAKFINGENPDSILDGFTLTNGLGTVFYANPTQKHNAGGGVYCHNSSPTIRNNIIINNWCKGRDGGFGGGLFFYKGAPVIVNNVVLKNKVSGINNAEGGIFSWMSSPIINNSIIRENGYKQIGAFSGVIISVNYSNIQGGYPGTGNIDVDPQYVDSFNDYDFHLQYTSPCRNTGTNTSPGLSNIDFEGDPRISEGIVDIGVDEFHRHIYCHGNKTPNGYIEVKLTGMPWSKPVGLWYGLNMLNTPLSSKYGHWYLAFPYSGPIDLGIMPMNGVWILSGYLPSSPPGPYSIYMQALIGDKLTNLCVMNVQ